MVCGGFPLARGVEAQGVDERGRFSDLLLNGFHAGGGEMAYRLAHTWNNGAPESHGARET